MRPLCEVVRQDHRARRTSLASGLDPDISIANARLQVHRVASRRGLDVAVVEQLVKKYTEGRQLLVLGEPGVNVVELNLALDDVSA